MPNYRLEEGSAQHSFQLSRAKVQIFGGGFANGKTTGLVIKSLHLVKFFPGCMGLLGRETYPKLNDTLRKEFFKWCPRHWIKKMPTQDDNSCYLINGSVVHFRYIAQRGKSVNEDGTTTSNLLSATYDWIGLDQVDDPGITHKDFLDLLGRLRGDTPYRVEDGEEDPSMPSDGPRWLMMTLNPSQNWAYHELIKPYIDWRDRKIFSDKLLVDDESHMPIVELCESDTYANKANLKPDFIKTLETTYKGQMRDRYLLGKWAAFEGLVHPEFDTEKHIVKRADMMEHLYACRERHVRIRAVEGYDFGIATPTCYLLGFVDDYGRVVLLDGFYHPNFDVMQHPNTVRKIRSRYNGLLFFPDPIIADPAIFRRVVVAGQAVRSTTIARILKDDGLNLRAGSSDILPGIAKVNSYIAGTPKTPHLTMGTRPGPLLYVAAELPWFQDEVMSYYWKRDSQGRNIDEPVDHNDHAMNTVKYMLSKLPDPSEIIIPEDALPPKWKFWQEMSMDDYRRVTERIQ
jgi:hypothetical protein